MRSEIEYDTTSENDVSDNRIKDYSYKVNDFKKATVNNSYDDAFKRLTNKQIKVGSAFYKKSITYDKTRIQSVKDVKGVSTLHNVSYSYDAMGRIISESDTADTSFNNTYTYDTYGQLIRENNKSLDKTYVYEYNGSGNIIGAKTYSYTTGTLDGVDPTSTDIYTYDSTVKDRLTAFKGDAITYNSMGCPVKLVDGSTTYTYTWTKGKLTGFTKFSSLGGRHSYTYTYDAYGRRIKKLYTYAPGSQISAVYTTRVTTNYTYDLSGRLVREQATEVDSELVNYTREFVYLYDGDTIVGVVFTRSGTTSTYYFDRNIKGDVVGIFNSSGTQVAKYEYDAWGNSRLSTLVSNNFSGCNSIRYRGYYYDTETGFYFLNSRYYSPQWRRFISPASASSLNPNSVNGLNLYCYAGNNPVGVAYSGFNSDVATSGRVGYVGNKIENISSRTINSGGLIDVTGKVSINWPKANTVAMVHTTVPIIKDPVVSWIFGNISYTATVQLNPAEAIYSFSDIGNDGFSVGMGVKLGDLFGSSAYISSDIGFGYSWQLTPWFTAGSSWSLENGLSISRGIIIGDTTHEITVSVGNGALLGYALCAGIAAIPMPGARAFAAGAACVIFIVNLFS